MWRGAATHAPKLSPRKSHQTEESDKTASARRKCRSTPCLLCKKEFSNRRAVNSGERLSCASLIARTVTVEHHGGTHADAQRADDCTCGGSSRRAARFVAEPRGHAPRSNARRGASCQIFFVSRRCDLCLPRLTPLPLFPQQPQIVLLREGTDTSQGKGQLISNINACMAVVDSVRTTLVRPRVASRFADPHVVSGPALLISYFR